MGFAEYLGTMSFIIANGLMRDAPLPGTNIRVWLLSARYPDTQYEGKGSVRSTSRMDEVPNKTFIECVVQTDVPVPNDVVVWTIVKWEPAE